MTFPPHSLRGRLTLAFSAVTALAVGGVACALALLVERAVWAPLDAGLAEEATMLAALGDLHPDQLAKTVHSIGEEQDLGPGKFVSVVGGNQQVLATFRTVPHFVSDRRPEPLTGLRLLRAGEGKNLHRVAWASRPTGGWVVLGVRAGGQALLCRRAKHAIGVAALGLVALLTALAWAVSSGATFDLDRLARELETIEAGSLDRRPPPPAATRGTRL